MWRNRVASTSSNRKESACSCECTPALLHIRPDTDDAACNARASVARGLGVGMSAAAQIVLVSMHNYGPTHDAVHATQRNKIVCEFCVHLAISARLNVAEVANVTRLRCVLRPAVRGATRIEMTAGARAALPEVSELVNVKSMLPWFETRDVNVHRRLNVVVPLGLAEGHRPADSRIGSTRERRKYAHGSVAPGRRGSCATALLG